MTNFSDQTIWTGDNLDILRGLNSASVDLIPEPAVQLQPQLCRAGGQRCGQRRLQGYLRLSRSERIRWRRGRESPRFAQHGLRNVGQPVRINPSLGTAEFISNSAILCATGTRFCAYAGAQLRPEARKMADFRIKSVIGIIVLLASATAGGTRSGEFGMRCPHCTVTIHPVWKYGWIDDTRTDGPCWQWTKTVCPACHKTAIKVRLRSIWGGAAPGEETEPVYPQSTVDMSVAVC